MACDWVSPVETNSGQPNESQMRPMTASMRWLFFVFFSSLRRLEEFPVVYFLFCSLPWNNRAGMTLWASAWSDLQPYSINTDTHLSGRRLNFPRYPHANSGPEGFRELLNRCPGTQLCPSSIPSCFSSSINPLIPVQVSFNGRTGSLERDLKGLTLPRGGEGHS